MSQTILVFSCIHFPYQHPDALAFLTALKTKYDPDHVLCLGDEADYSALSYHETNPDMMSAGDELNAAKRSMLRLAKLFPTITFTSSNHGSMPYRKAMTAGIPKALMRTPREVWGNLPGWKWVESFEIVDNGFHMLFTHSLGSNILNAAKDTNRCLIQGHHHSKSNIVFFGRLNELKWGMQVGWLGNDKHPAFDYNKLQSKRPMLTVGVIINGIPMLVPMVVNARGRWVGNL